MKKIFFIFTLLMLYGISVLHADPFIFNNPKFQAFDSNGDPLASGKLYTYDCGTTDNRATYPTAADALADTNANANPVVLDSRGEATVYVRGCTKFVLKTSLDSTIWTMDNIDITSASGSRYPTLSEYKDSGSDSALSVAVTDIGATETTLIIDNDDTMLGNVSIPSTLGLKFINGSAIDLNSHTLTIDRPGLINAPPQQQIFSGTGTLTFTNPGTIYVMWAASGDYSTDDTDEIQMLIDSAPALSVLDFGSNSYRIARNTGTNDRYGIKIVTDDITLRADKAKIRRYNTDISTYAYAYPIILIGTPDSNVASSTDGVLIEGFQFVGEDTRHSTSGTSLHDGRYIIELKNTTQAKIKDCEFTKIDSSAIWFQKPDEYDYANSEYYNTTKNYNAKIINCDFYAESHSTAGRALLHAIDITGCDHTKIKDGYFEWCDNGITGEGTYDDLADVETDTWVGNVGAVKRTGRWVLIENCEFYNSSEHALYLAMMDVSVVGGMVTTDDQSICNSSAVKMRSRASIVDSVSISTYSIAVQIQEPAFLVTVDGCTITTTGDSGGGAIDISPVGISAYIDARDYLDTYYPMSNINITNNNITLPSGAQTGVYGSAFRLYTDASDANYTENNEIDGVNISGNIVKNHRHGIYVVNDMLKGVLVDGNTFRGKSFVSAGFSTGTTMNTYSVLLVNSGDTYALRWIKFKNNNVFGTAYLFATHNGGGTNVDLPWGIEGNSLSYVQYFKTSDMLTPDSFNVFHGNDGYYFIDRTSWATGFALFNGLDTGQNNTADDFSGVWAQYTLADDATPSIFGKEGPWVTGGTTTITDFDDGVVGQKLYIIADHSVTITDGTNIFLNGSGNFNMQASDTLTLFYKSDTKWYELGRSDN